MCEITNENIKYYDNVDCFNRALKDHVINST